MDSVVKFYQTGTFTVGNRLLDPALRAVQATTGRSNALNSGHRACQGCGEALGARYAIDAAMEATQGRLIAANATGCLPMQRGMCGPEATLETVSQIFALEEDGGITKSPHTVDFVQGSAMSGGVFITVRILDERIQQDLEYLKVGKGKYYTFFRPYHLWFLEAPISVARAHLYGQATLVPLERPVAEVMAIAKRDLAPGDRLDDERDDDALVLAGRGRGMAGVPRQREQPRADATGAIAAL